jgi:hypothetical protein
MQLGQWLPWLKTKAPLEAVESASGSAEVTLKHFALRFDRPAQVDFDATAMPRDVRAVLKVLPAEVSATGGAIRANSREVAFDKVAVAMLDARGVASGSYAMKGPAVQVSVAEGVVGERLLRWALERGEVPQRFAPKTPLRFTANRIAWAPKESLRADATVEFPAGPQVGLALAQRPGLLELSRVTIKDARSDALLSATVASDLIHARYSGRLQGRSIAAMLRQPPSDSGSVEGELRLVVDRAQPERTSAEGRLRVQGLDLTWLAGRKALIERAELTATGDGTRIDAARFGWEDQLFELRGEGRRTAQGPVVEARIESAGVDLFKLFPPPDPNAPKKARSALWPLPVSGRIELRAGYVQYKDHRVEPLDGVVTLEPGRLLAEVREARICGLSVPMQLRATPDDNELSAQIRMRGEPLERAVRCLTGGGVEISGSADLEADLSTRGRRPHLLRDMTGTARAELRDGRVKKFALIGNILAFRGIDSIGEMRKQDGFPYKSMVARGRFAGGAFLVEESFFDSDAVRLAAHGRVDLLGPGSQLNVLVGLFTRVDRVAEAVPILGDIFGGSMTALPIAVHGDIRDPLIVPLGPRAVTDQLLGIFERTLKLPTKLVPAPQAKP